MKNRKGFTLIEIMAVIVILGIILTIAISSFNKIAIKQREKEYENKVDYIELAAEKWAIETNLSKTTTITVFKLVDSSYFQADSFNVDENEYIVNDPRDNKSMLYNTITIVMDNGEPVATFNDIVDSDLYEQEMEAAKIKIAAYSYDVTTNKVLEVVKQKNQELSSINWTNKAVLLAVEPEAEYSIYDKVIYSSNGKSNTKQVIDSNIKNVANIKVGDVINPDLYANLYLVNTNLFINAEYTISVNVKDKGIKSNSLTVRIDKEAPKLVTSKTNEYTNKPRPVTIKGSDGAGSGLKGFYVSKSANDFSTSNFHATNSETIVNLKNGNYYVYAEDNAGNKSSVNILAITNVDEVSPTCVIHASGQKGDNDWYIGNVSFSLEYSDNESGVATHKLSATSLTEDVESYKVTAEVKDNAGNEKKCELVVKKDSKKPETPKVEANDGILSGEWHKDNTTLQISGSTSISGITYSWVTNNTSIAPNGSGNSVNFENNTPASGINYTIKACNGAGKCSDVVNYVLKIDKTEPTSLNIVASDGIASGEWHKDNFTLTGSGANNISGNTYYYGTSSNPTSTTRSSITSNTNETTYYVKVCSGSGLCKEKSYVVKLDKTNPTCTLLGDSTIWTNDSRTITWGCSDDDSGCNVLYSGSSKVFSTTTKTTTINSYVIKDVAGNTVSCSAKTVNVYVDKTPPSCNVNALVKSSGITTTITCNDENSGCSNTNSTGDSDLKTDKSYVIKDEAGNSTTCSINITGGTANSCLTGSNTCKEGYTCPTGYSGGGSSSTCTKVTTVTGEQNSCNTGSNTCTGGYKCPEGYSGGGSSSTCTKVTTVTGEQNSCNTGSNTCTGGYKCPEGYSGGGSSSYCYKTESTTGEYSSCSSGSNTCSGGYYCPSGYSGGGSSSSCYKTEYATPIISSENCTSGTSEYVCPSGYTNNNNGTCSKTVTTNGTEDKCYSGTNTCKAAYVCPTGYSGGGSSSTCSKTETISATKDSCAIIENTCKAGLVCPSGYSEYNSTQCVKYTTTSSTTSKASISSCTNVSDYKCESGSLTHNGSNWFCILTETSSVSCGGFSYNSSTKKCTGSKTGYPSNGGSCTSVCSGYTSWSQASNGKCTCTYESSPSCPSGYSFKSSSNNCVKTTETSPYCLVTKCPSGYNMDNGTCKKAEYKSKVSSDCATGEKKCKEGYTCPSGYTFSGSGSSTKCSKTVTSTGTWDTCATGNDSCTTGYKCPSGYSGGGSSRTCSKTESVAASINVTGGSCQLVRSCPSGYSSSGSGDSMTCSKTETVSGTYDSCYYGSNSCSSEYKCPEGYSGGGSNSYCYKTTSTTGTYDSCYSGSNNCSSGYTCPSGYSGGGSSSTCSKTETTTGTYDSCYSGSNTCTSGYKCPSGYSGGGSSSVCTKVDTQNGIKDSCYSGSNTCKSGYTCPSGYSGGGVNSSYCYKM